MPLFDNKNAEIQYQMTELLLTYDFVSGETSDHSKEKGTASHVPSRLE